MIETLKCALKPGGALVLITPNATFVRSVLGLKQRKSPVDRSFAGSILKLPQRAVIFSPRGLRALLKRRGMIVLQLRGTAPGAPGDRTVEFAVHPLSRIVQLFAPRIVLSHPMICLARQEG